MELSRGVPVRDIFGPQAEIDPEGTRTLLEWYLSSCGSGGKDGRGMAVVYDEQGDTLVPRFDFRERVLSWKPEERKADYYRLSVMPDEPTFRAYLSGSAFFHNKLGRIIRDEDWPAILEARRLELGTA